MNGKGYGALLALGLLVCAPAAGAQEGDETALPPRVEFAEYYVLPGIDTIPHRAIRLSPAEVRQFFLVTDIFEGGHARGVRNSACLSYITSVDCSEPLNPRTTPFSFLARGKYGGTIAESAADSVREIVRRGWTLVTKSDANAVGGILDQFGADLPFVLIDSAGNDATDNFFESDGLRYDRKRDTFVRLDDAVSDQREAMARNIRPGGRGPAGDLCLRRMSLSRGCRNGIVVLRVVAA